MRRRGASRAVGADAAAALEEGYSIPVRDPLWGHVYFTAELEALVACPAFRKLSRIAQLGPASIVYPGATHTRAAHSIGVYHLARRLLKALVERGAGAWATGTGARSFLAAALLHDLGHFPYAHSLKELPLEEHEALTGRAVLEEPTRSLVGRTGADPYMTAAIVDHALPVRADAETLFYRKLLSGVLDPDKMDYLNRDARFCGVPYGAQDVDFTYSRLHPHPERGVDVDARGLASVEAVLFAKYLMYRAVYWHRDVRAATAMMKTAVSAALADGAIAAEELYGLDDAGLFALLAARGHPSFELARGVRDGRLLRVAAEIPFDASLPAHRTLADLEFRPAVQERIAADLAAATGRRPRPWGLIVDLPEPISFETGLFVADEGRPFEESATAFASGTVAAFARTLRVVRICVGAEEAAALEDSPAARDAAFRSLASP